MYAFLGGCEPKCKKFVLKFPKIKKKFVFFYAYFFFFLNLDYLFSNRT
jgi:hypothetical protein